MTSFRIWLLSKVEAWMQWVQIQCVEEGHRGAWDGAHEVERDARLERFRIEEVAARKEASE